MLKLILYLMIMSHNPNQEVFRIPNTSYEINVPKEFTIQGNRLELTQPLADISFMVLDDSHFTKENPTGGFLLEDAYPNIKRFPVDNEYSVTDIILHHYTLKDENERPHLLWIAKTESNCIISTTIIQDLVEEDDLLDLIKNISEAFSTLRKTEK